MKVGVVTGFIPLPVKHLSEDQYRELGQRLSKACEGHTFFRGGGKLEDCWAYTLCTGLPPDMPVPADRYVSPEVNVMSHIVQHQRTTWAEQASKAHPYVEVWCWLDYGVLKQGAWRNNPVTEYSVKRFLARISHTPSPMKVIPFPGIAEKGTVYPGCNNWRFCGSTHIWPDPYISAIDLVYKRTLTEWISRHKTVPLDLPIWALVEQNSKLPFRWYPAEYDASQLDNYELTAWQDAGML
jgi:hypothetical protein